MKASARIKKERNFWPHAVVGSILFIIVACAWTVKIAMENPVQFDQSYLAKYELVDNTIHDIRAKQQVFDTQFNATFLQEKVQLNRSTMLPLRVIDKASGEPLRAAQVTLLVTRPDTNAYNQEFTATTSTDGAFLLGPVSLDKPGRWQLITKIETDTAEGFVEYEIFATP
jgi:hypothetical protein